MKKFTFLSLMLTCWLPFLSANAQPISLKSFPGGITEIINLNGKILFSANDGVNGFELWKSDGTAAGTVLVKDINPGAGSSSPVRMIVVNGVLYFAASNGTAGVELWKSDGTTAGTVMVKDIRAGALDSTPAWMTDVNGTLYFRANNGINGSEVWKSNGTEAGTVLVKDINYGIGEANPQYLTNVNGTLFFKANNGSSGLELWKSDGTFNGTVMVKDINPGPNESSISYLANMNGTLYFVAWQSSTGNEVWKSDGTAAGTVMVKDIYPGPSPSEAYGFTNLNGTTYFKAYDFNCSSELWKSDGTTAGTVMVKDIFPGSEQGGSPGGLTVMNNQLFFAAYYPNLSRELWKSDGTAIGTKLVKDISPGLDASEPTNLTEMNGVLYMNAKTAATGFELWKSDGTEAGTLPVGEINPGPADASPFELTPINGVLYFAATGSNGQKQLFRLNPCVNPPAPNLGANGQNKVTVTQNSAPVVLSASNCNGQLNWSGPGGPNNNTGTGNITVPTSFTGTYVYSATCLVNACLSPAASATVVVQPVVNNPNPGGNPGSVTGNFEGYLDKVECGTIRGWVWDKDKPNTVMKLEFFANGNSIGTIDANIFRQDLKDQGKGNGEHAYSFPTPASIKNGQTYSISAKVYNSTYVLKWAPKTLTCPSGSRLATESAESQKPLEVTVLGNPIQNNQVEVNVRGAEGGPLRFLLTDLQGRPLAERHIEQATATEHQRFSVNNTTSGILLLRVSNLRESQTIKLLKTN
ncbi:ELWxxDGT repeat protein [Larkinella terrae]|uniref:T9SS type A sorting domain-containing protein n=1 Tax=Larkinella terrae TaxID=2025311 RepID=A0A7K0ERF6_9BACT|nr:ELWxxDGT repeat protein [Larkinella terrae]MRS64393.1 hypothetical protein [Larkinella terrae]